MRSFVRIFLPGLLIVGLFAVPTAAYEPAATEPTETTTETATETPTEAPGPVYEDITFYLHGTERVGDLDMSTLGHMPMDTTAPTATQTASRQILNYVRGPNAKCSGNWLFPTWDGVIDGQVQGNVKVTLQTLTHPGNSYTVELFADGGGGCNDSYVPPVATKTLSFAPGQATTEILFENVDFTVGGQLTLMVRPASNPPIDTPAGPQASQQPHQGRVFYDSTTVKSRIELKCLLPEGKTTCLS